MLGIIIGVASVITMLAIGQGSSNSIKAEISTLGTNVIIIIPGASRQGGIRMESGTSIVLEIEDIEAIRNNCSSVKYISPVVNKTSQIVNLSQNWRTRVYGVYPEYLDIRNLNILEGSCFTLTDNKRLNKICIIGKTVSDNLFGENINPVGQTIRIDKIPFKIIGLLEEKGNNMMGHDQDDIIIAPFLTVQKRMLAKDYIQMIFISAINEELIKSATEEIDFVLRERKNLSATEQATYQIRTQKEIENIFTSTSNIMVILLASIAVISLIVGGIGIMNIMLVSVTERTKEIGIRMAVGARGKDIMLQFLIEAILLSITGGVFGILLGIVSTKILTNVLQWPVFITTESIIISFVFSSIVGIFFGWYPAKKAASLRPIEALRYE